MKYENKMTYTLSLPEDAREIAQSISGHRSMPLYRAPIYPYPVSSFKRLIRHSALARYIVFNAKLNPFGIAQRRADFGLRPTSKSGSPEDDLLYTPRAQQVIQVVIEQILLAQPQAELIFFGDADRREMYRRKEAHVITPPPPLPISKWMRSICQLKRNRCRWIDPTESFFSKIQSGVRVDYVHNRHWNTEGHQALATLIYQQLDTPVTHRPSTPSERKEIGHD